MSNAFRYVITSYSIHYTKLYEIPAEMTNNITTLLIAPFIDYDLSTITGEQSRCFWDEVTAYNNTTTGVSNINDRNDRIIRTDIYTLAGQLIKTQIDSKTIDRNNFV